MIKEGSDVKILLSSFKVKVMDRLSQFFSKEFRRKEKLVQFLVLDLLLDTYKSLVKPKIEDIESAWKVCLAASQLISIFAIQANYVLGDDYVHTLIS